MAKKTEFIENLYTVPTGERVRQFSHLKIEQYDEKFPHLETGEPAIGDRYVIQAKIGTSVVILHEEAGYKEEIFNHQRKMLVEAMYKEVNEMIRIKLSEITYNCADYETRKKLSDFIVEFLEMTKYD